MPAIRARRGGSGTRSHQRAWLFGVVVATASAVVGPSAVHGDSPHRPSSSAPTRAETSVGEARQPSGSASPVAFVAGPADTPTDVTPAGTPAAPAPRRVVHTMSMDAPIQGGLTAHQEQKLSARLLAAHTTPSAAPKARSWTPAMGRTAAARATSWLGMPYSWAGGSSTGPTPGRCDPGSGGDLDCHVVGFDCSGLSMYAWGAYASLPHLASAQLAAGGFHPRVSQLLPGDLVFFSAYIAGGTGHVGVFVGKGMVVEAPQSGSVVRRSTLAEMMADDGVYRGAVRPMTGAAPTLSSPSVAVPAAGGLLTVRGSHLADVNAVRVGQGVVSQFVRHTDTSLTLRVPAQHAGVVTLTAVASWGARSVPVRLTVVDPRQKAPAPAPRPAPSSSTPHPGTHPSPPPSTVSSTPPSSPPSTSPTSSPSGKPSGKPSSGPAGAPSSAPTPAPTGSSSSAHGAEAHSAG